MSVWSKLMTALRGGMHEVGENLVDGQALRILDQEIRDAETELGKSKEALAEIMARQKLAAERVRQHEEKVTEYEGYTIKALEENNETLAHEIATKLAALEAELATWREQAGSYAASVEQLRQAVLQTETSIRRMKQQVDTVKATESVQKAQMAVAQRYGGSQSKMHTAVESLEKVKQRQAERAAKMEATAELAAAGDQDAQLQRKLRDAGIAPDNGSADKILARLKEKAAKPS